MTTEVQQCETCGGRIECSNPSENWLREVWTHETVPVDRHEARPDYEALDPNFFPAKVVQWAADSVRAARLSWVGGADEAFDEALARAVLNSLHIHVTPSAVPGRPGGGAILVGVPGPPTADEIRSWESLEAWTREHE